MNFANVHDCLYLQEDQVDKSDLSPLAPIRMNRVAWVYHTAPSARRSGLVDQMLRVETPGRPQEYRSTPRPIPQTICSIEVAFLATLNRTMFALRSRLCRAQLWAFVVIGEANSQDACSS